MTVTYLGLRRAFIVDDNAMNAELASYMLEADGLEVECANDATQAVARIESFAPDVILMDIQLPGVDGLALTRLLRARPATRNIVVIAFTAFAMKGDEARLRAAGCDGYLAKPITVATFAADVRRLLDAGPSAA